MSQNGQIIFVGSLSGQSSYNKLSQSMQEKFQEAAKSDKPSLVHKLRESFVEDVKNDQWEKNGWCSSGYGTSKLLLQAWVNVLSHKHPEVVSKDLKVNLMCPGYCRTDMTNPNVQRTAEQGAQVCVYLQQAKDIKQGGMYSENNLKSLFE